MSELSPDPKTPTFSALEEQRSFTMKYAMFYSAVAIVALVVSLVMFLMRRPATPPANADYAPNLTLSGIQMSEADSQTGGKLIYIDGRISNHGPAAITGVRVQVAFPSDQGAPQLETVPMNVIYMRDPYVDTRSIAAAPLAPGASADFRLIFDDVTETWNQQLPQLKMTQVAIK